MVPGEQLDELFFLFTYLHTCMHTCSLMYVCMYVAVLRSFSPGMNVNVTRFRHLYCTTYNYMGTHSYNKVAD